MVASAWSCALVPADSLPSLRMRSVEHAFVTSGQAQWRLVVTQAVGPDANDFHACVLRPPCNSTRAAAFWATSCVGAVPQNANLGQRRWSHVGSCMGHGPVRRFPLDSSRSSAKRIGRVPDEFCRRTEASPALGWHCQRGGPSVGIARIEPLRGDAHRCRPEVLGNKGEALHGCHQEPASFPTEQDIINWCRGNMAVYKIPRKVQFVDVLPRAGAGM